MSNWFQDRRQEFILATLKQFGQVRRADIARQFDVSIQLASSDIQNFLAANSKIATYDLSAKAYIIVEPADELPERCSLCHAVTEVFAGHPCTRSECPYLAAQFEEPKP